ncbi:MAG: acetate--CoA ligase family protein [Syntrophaceae bacterium]|nr:acetate--CoA ligase family protein [Syntrophaceae bacterium]
MEFFFNPRGIAVVGATPNPTKGGYAILKNLINTFEGTVYPVNPRYHEMEGLTCYPSISALPEKPDLAILFISAEQIVSTVEACIAKGISGVIIQSGGFSEIGGEGESIQLHLSKLAREAGIRIWGPNCMGIVDGRKGHVFSFTDPQVLSPILRPGPLSFVVQSGMLSAGFVVDLLSHKTAGFNKVCSIGNKADVNECDLLQYLLDDPATGVIGFYLESFVDLRRFIDIYEKHGKHKPVVILKGGKSEAGKRAALSHTASLAGNYHIPADALRQAGIFLAHDFHQLIDLCRTLEMVRPRQERSTKNVAILTFSGASGIVAADFMFELGLNAADLNPETKTAIEKFFPAWMPAANPVDVWPAMEHHSGKGLDIYSLALEASLRDPGVDACMIHTFAGFTRVRLNLEETARLSRQWDKPVFIWVLGERERVLEFQVEARKLGIPVFHELYRTVECLAAALHRTEPEVVECKNLESPALPHLMLPSTRGVLNEYDAKRILKEAGLYTVKEYRTDTPELCREFAERIGYPVVLKGLEKGVVHKSEAGLIKTDIWNEFQMMASFLDLKDRMAPESTVLLQKQIRGPLELILGYLRDPQYGPCVMVGLGGIFAETLDDTAFALAPLNRSKAMALIRSLKNQPMLSGIRGIPPVPVETLAGYLVILGQLGSKFPAIREIDINPLIISATGPVIVDATIILDPC